MKKIKVEQLTKEAFAEFGEVLSYEGREDCGAKGSHTWYPQVVVRDTPTSINLMEVFRKPFTVKKFEAHDWRYYRSICTGWQTGSGQGSCILYSKGNGNQL